MQKKLSRRGDQMSKPNSKWQLLRYLPQLLKQSWLLFKDPQVPFLRKLLVSAASLGYLIWPLDLIPDLPLFGQVDDFFLIFLLLNWFVNKGGKDLRRKKNEDVIEADYYIEDEEKTKKKKKKAKFCHYMSGLVCCQLLKCYI